MFDLIKEYAFKRADLLKLEATEKTVTIIGTVTFIVAAMVFAFLFLLLFLFGIGFLIGEYLNNYGYGLLIVAGFFLLILIILVAMRKTIKNKVANKILESIYD